MDIRPRNTKIDMIGISKHIEYILYSQTSQGSWVKYIKCANQTKYVRIDALDAWRVLEVSKN